MNDIETYLSGEMNAEDRAAFEAEMERNPDLAHEVALMRHLTEEIETVELEDRVDEALSDLPEAAQTEPKHQWWLPLLLVGLVAIWLLFFQKKDTPPQLPASPPPTENPPQEQPIDEQQPTDTDQETPPTKEQKTAPPKQPIAEAKPTETPPPASIPAPRLRGSGQSADTSRQALLDAVWYTEYPPNGLRLGEDFKQVDELLRQRDFSKSYALLQLLERKMPANDTLFFLKGYCLLERGEGGEALRYFDQIEDNAAFGKELLEWYGGLSFLLVGDEYKAKRTFQSILAQPGHAFLYRAERALAFLQ